MIGKKETANAKWQAITAINILLEPDETMFWYADLANDRLVKAYPQGFLFDLTHKPHITLLQRYVYKADISKISATAKQIFADRNISEWPLKAVGYDYSPWKQLGIAGIVIEPKSELLELQEKLIKAVAPFTVRAGTAEAFYTTPESPDIIMPTIDYVTNFVPQASGNHFNPHVTIGIAPQEYLNKMLAEPFDTFSFSAAGASIYHIGNFGTARKKISELSDTD